MGKSTKRDEDERIHQILTALPEAGALRKAAIDYAREAAMPLRGGDDRDCDLANRRLLSTAVDFTRAIRRAARRDAKRIVGGTAVQSIYRVKPGDTLSGIARATGCHDPSQPNAVGFYDGALLIARVNRIEDTSHIEPGWMLIIPLWSAS